MFIDTQTKISLTQIKINTLLTACLSNGEKLSFYINDADIQVTLNQKCRKIKSVVYFYA
jgi:hypothetical protein